MEQSIRVSGLQSTAVDFYHCCSEILIQVIDRYAAIHGQTRVNRWFVQQTYLPLLLFSGLHLRLAIP